MVQDGSWRGFPVVYCYNIALYVTNNEQHTMSIPLRVSDDLFHEAEIEGSLMNRSAAKQVEFWAELGKRVAISIAPTDMLALMQGIAKVRIDLPDCRPISSNKVFAEVKRANTSAQTGAVITRGAMYYEASQTRPGMLDQVMPDGSRQTGHFRDGNFWPE